MKRHISGRLDLRDRILVSLCRNSFRFYTNACVVVTLRTKDQAIRIPLVKGIGLRNLSFDHNPLNPTYKENWIARALDAIYGYRTGCLVDAGANIGKILVSLMVKDRNIPYFAFEPNLNCCFYLQQLLDANNLRRHKLYPVALSDRSGSATLEIGEDFDVRGSIVKGFRQATARHAREVVLECGDRFLAAEPVAIIKLDTEGAELSALRGLSRTISASRPVILCEILDFADLAPAAAEIRRAAAEGIAALFSEWDYALFRVTAQHGLHEMNLGELERTLDHVENNYIAVPRTESRQLIDGFHAARPAGAAPG